ncbi:MAG: dihydrodipicolinate synthase family protein, partial [Fidelibacterota bacterium]
MVHDMDISGAYAPILTPFSQDGRTVNLAAFHQHLAFLDKAGLSGVLVLGTNGEFGYLSKEERLQLVESVIGAGTSLRIIVGGTVPDSPEDTQALVDQLGEYSDRLTAILVAPPFYDTYSNAGEVSEAVVLDFYHRLAGIQSRLPLVLYNVPVPPEGRMTAPVTPGMVGA